METFTAKQPENTFLFLKVNVRANSLFTAWTGVKLLPGEVLITTSFPGTSTGSIPPNSHGWFKLGRTKDFVGKRLVIETHVTKTENVEITCALLEDNDMFLPFIHFDEYRPNVITKATRLNIDIQTQ